MQRDSTWKQDYNLSIVRGIRYIQLNSGFVPYTNRWNNSTCTIIAEKKPVCSASKWKARAHENVISTINKLYGDEDDERQSLQRYYLAKDDAKEIGLLEEHGSNLVYGDVSLDLALTSMEIAKPVAGEQFLDIGSGFGRVVLAVSGAFPQLKECVGVEVLPQVHEYALKNQAEWKSTMPIRFICCDFRKRIGREEIEKADIVFAFVTAWDGAANLDGIVWSLAEVLLEEMKVGRRVVVVDGRLPLSPCKGKRFEVVAEYEDENQVVGKSRVIVYKMKSAK